MLLSYVFWIDVINCIVLNFTISVHVRLVCTTILNSRRLPFYIIKICLKHLPCPIASSFSAFLCVCGCQIEQQHAFVTMFFSLIRYILLASSFQDRNVFSIVVSTFLYSTKIQSLLCVGAPTGYRSIY